MLKLLKTKKGIITHPVTWSVVAFLLGMLLMYLLAKGIIETPLEIC